MAEWRVALDENSRAEFHNNTSYCVGTGRMGLALQKEYQDELLAVQAVCGFKHIRGHGLFSDDMAIYQERRDPDGEERVQYCFTYLDRVTDYYIAAGLRPFLELGFMPGKLASGEQTIFYWKGHTTPPKDMKKWTDLVEATLTHLKERYGEEEVSSWPVEVWNEPNLPGFWEHADKAKYLELYDATARAVKRALPSARVGGPAICGGNGSQEWVRDFLTFCRDHGAPVDFVTRHAYMGQTPEHRGRYLYHPMCSVEYTVAEMAETRAIIESFPEYRGMPMYITEFNTSYNPFCPIHDTVFNAALCAGLLASLGDVAQGYSYWTFGDVFEEMGVPTRPFHGGFGLMAAGNIPKPTLWTFAFFSRLKGECAHRDRHSVVTRRGDGGYEGVIWNEARENAEFRFVLDLPGNTEMTLTEEIVEDGGCDPLKVWHDLGEPSVADKETVELLRKSGTPRVSSGRAGGGAGPYAAELKGNSVRYFRLKPLKAEADPGYDYTYYSEVSE